MTEDQARTKWCPFSQKRYASLFMDEFAPDEVEEVKKGMAIRGSDNREITCIASKCMAWRADGYCGLAGKPND